MNFSRSVTRFLLMISVCITGSFLYAQETTSELAGTVTDSKGVPVEGVTITVKHEPTGFVSKATSNHKGYYFLNNLQPGGPYSISYSSMGFKTEDRKNVMLSLGSNNGSLKLLEATTALADVTVSAKSGRRAGANVQIGQNQIRTMPVLSRSLQDITKLTPQSNNNSFAGTNFRYNNVTIDGAINNDAIGFSPSLGGQTNASGQPGSSTRTNPVSLDAIQDVQVYLTPYDVKIGNFVGGSVNAVSRSGSNDVHGSVYGYGRSAFMVGPNNAGDKSALPSDFHDYQTGFRVGLPIVKNKLFFFTNEEITRRVDPVILAAGSADNKIITLAQAQAIDSVMRNKYGVADGAGAYGNTTIYSNSTKFFNRLDWVINSKNRLSLRNNTITSEATNLERDLQNFRFGDIDFRQVNNQTSTVAELKTNFNSGLSNSLVLGFSSIHDYREPSSNPSLPQMEISSNGGTIFLGTDREGAIFNMKQKTYELTDNFTMVKGNNTFTFGTHNEFYDITYGFVNSWNGRVAYSTVNDFLNNNPNRVRANYNYTNNTRDYIMSNPPAEFKVNMYSVYAQDEIRLGKLKLTPGIRVDKADVPNKQPLSSKTTNSPVDPNYGTTYTYTLPKDIRNDFLGQLQVSPRLGFTYDVTGKQQFIIRGGTGLFTGRIPFAWMGYAYYNNGVTYGAYDQRSSSPYKPGTDPVKDALASNIGEANFVKNQGKDINDPSGSTQVDLIDNNFKLPQAWRSNLALEYNAPGNWKFSVEGIYTKVIYDLKFQQINYVDNPTYWVYDTRHQQPIYSGAKINPLYTNAYLLSNTNEGWRYSLTGQISKTFDFGLSFSLAYTYGHAKDITNGIRNSMESNWQLNQALSPNNPQLAYSNFDIRHRFVSTVNYKTDWDGRNKFVSNFSLFFSSASGLPFSYGLVNTAYDGTGQSQSLVYIPTTADLPKFFADPTQAAAFDAYVNNDKYLKTRRGDFTERNGGRTPWNTTLDFRFTQDFNLKVGAKMHTISFTYDIFNLTNLLNPNWGWVYFSPNTFNSMASTGLKVTAPASAGAYPVYSWANPGLPYSIDLFTSRYSMQAGLRYSF